jgi:hypothetical protein
MDKLTITFLTLAFLIITLPVLNYTTYDTTNTITLQTSTIDQESSLMNIKAAYNKETITIEDHGKLMLWKDEGIKTFTLEETTNLYGFKKYEVVKVN